MWQKLWTKPNVFRKFDFRAASHSQFHAIIEPFRLVHCSKHPLPIYPPPHTLLITFSGNTYTRHNVTQLAISAWQSMSFTVEITICTYTSWSRICVGNTPLSALHMKTLNWFRNLSFNILYHSSGIRYSSLSIKVIAYLYADFTYLPHPDSIWLFC